MPVSSANPNAPEHPLPETKRFRLVAWVVSPATGEIARGGKVARLEPKAMDLLVYLASHPGEVVPRQDLERQVWRGALVGYDAITGTVIKLRKALDDRSRESRYIATIPKRGYRLIAPVSSVEEDVSVTDAADVGTHSLPLSKGRALALGHCGRTLQSQTKGAERGVIDARGGTEAHGVAPLIRIHAVPVVDHRRPEDAFASP